MDIAILSTSAGFIGSLVGGASTFAASWITQHKVLGTQEVNYGGMRKGGKSVVSDAVATDIFCQDHLILGDVASGESLEPFRPPSRAAASVTVSTSSRDRRCTRTGTTSLGTHDLPGLVRAGRTGSFQPAGIRNPTIN